MTRNHDHRFLPEKLDNEVPVPIAGGAYVATPVVAMCAPIVASSTCHRATLKAHGMHIVAWYAPTTANGAYVPTVVVGTYVLPALPAFTRSPGCNRYPQMVVLCVGVASNESYLSRRSALGF